ncbi:MAG: dynamin family GTPase [Faunusvirus sp.]|jgi:GTPase SAR1 family protein|uniref:Dynamin family GTPase n=1 Tax=Faunusvirus sp. TaxID=2487766 RepID=A0A3G4ZW56_9VIRU|nr:MAG: dynamin family GTPase [Faunusvirus sp.]
MTHTTQHDDDLSISIAIMGAVSVGKSTLLNGLFVEQYSDMKMQRTTMSPQVYYETDDKSKLLSADDIRNTNSQINEKILHDEKQLTLNDCNETVHYVDKIYDFNIALKPECKLHIYDIPGLNDAKNDVYFEYVTQNFYKFDIVLFIVDINSSFNTSDEKRILNTITDNIKIALDSNKKVHMITILNKCDNLELDSDGKLKLDSELDEMFNQVKQTINEVGNKKNILQYINNYIFLSGEDVYIYRNCVRYPNKQLDIKHVNKIGKNMVGGLNWNKLSEKDRNTKFADILKDMDRNLMFTLCGFNELRDMLSGILVDNELDFLLNKVQNILTTIDKHDVTNTLEYETMMYHKLCTLATNIQKIYNFSCMSHINTHIMNKIEEFIKVNNIETVTNQVQFDALDNIKLQVITFCNSFAKWFTREQLQSIKSYIMTISDTANKFLLTTIRTIVNDPIKLLSGYKQLKNNKYTKLPELIVELTATNMGIGKVKEVDERTAVIENIYYSDVMITYFTQINKLYGISADKLIAMIFNWLLDKLDAYSAGSTTIQLYISHLKLYLMKLDTRAINNTNIRKQYDVLTIYADMKSKSNGELTREQLAEHVNMNMLDYLKELVTDSERVQV